MKSIKSKIQISMLSVVLVGAVLIGVITALLNSSGIDDVMTKTLGPATQMAADAATAQELSDQSLLMNNLVRKFQLS